MTGTGVLFRDVSVLVQNLLLGIAVLVMLLCEALGARQSRQLRERQQMRDQLCRRHG